MKEEFKKELENQVNTALKALENIPDGNLTNLIAENKMENGRLFRTDSDENKADVEWRESLDKAYDILYEFAKKYGVKIH